MASKAQEPVIGDGSLHIGDRVVYPNQGICRITGVAMKHIAGHDVEMVSLSREEDGATVMVPKAKVMGIGLRRVADVAAIDKVFDDLSASGNDAQLDWKVRHRENAERMSGGGLTGTVEVLKSLHALSRIRPLPQKERELYDSARHLLVSETAAAMNIPLHVAEDNLDYALWPPVGMKRKGRVLDPATLGPPPPSPVKGAEDDDLGFEDEEAEAAPATPAAKGEEEEEEDKEGGEEESAPKTKAPAGKKAAAGKPATKASAKLSPAALAAKPAAALAAVAAPKAEAVAAAKPAAVAAAKPAAVAAAPKPPAAPIAARHAPQAVPAKPAAGVAKPAPAPKLAAPAKAVPAKAAEKPAAAKAKPAAAAKKAPAAKKAAPAAAAKTKPKGKK